MSSPNPERESSAPVPEFSVIIPCRGHAREVTNCLRSVLAQVGPSEFEVIVVDSAGDPDVAAAVREIPQVSVVRSNEPLTPGRARNLGLRRARGRLLAFIDADCVADPGWLIQAREALGRPEVRLVGGSILDLDRTRWIALADNRLQFADQVATRSAGATRHCPSCNIAMRREDLLNVGGFPPSSGGEDVLLCDLIGSRWPGGIWFEPRMKVRHAGRATWKTYLRHQADLGFWRGVLRLHLRPWQAGAGRFRLMIPVVAARRMINLLRSGFRFGGLGKTLLLVPVLAPGVWSYSAGFARGCREGVA